MTILQDGYNGPPPASTKTRPTVDYQTFVIQYANLQKRNVLGVFAGVAIMIGAAIRLDGNMLVILAALGLGLAASGAAGFLVAGAAHDNYSRRLGVTTSTTYATPEPDRGVRAFVASGSGRVIRRGRFSLDTVQWRKLYQAAAKNDGRLTRDAVVAAKLPRHLYGNGSWGDTLAELARVGVVDAAGRVTRDGWAFYETEIAPPPDGEVANRSRIVRPTATDRATGGSYDD